MKTKEQKKELLVSLRFKPMGTNQAYMMRNFHTFMIEEPNESDEAFIKRLNDYFIRNRDKERIGFDNGEFLIGSVDNIPVMNLSANEIVDSPKEDVVEKPAEPTQPEDEDEMNITEDDLPFSEFSGNNENVGNPNVFTYTCMKDSGKEEMTNKGVFSIILDKPLLKKQVVAIANERTVRALFDSETIAKTKEGYYKHILKMLPYTNKKDFPYRVLVKGGQLIHIGMATKIEYENGKISIVEYNEHPEAIGLLPTIIDEVVIPEENTPVEEAINKTPETNIVTEESTHEEAPQPVVKKKRGRPKKVKDNEDVSQKGDKKFEPIPKYVQPTLSEDKKIDDDTWQKMVKNPPVEGESGSTHNSIAEEVKNLSNDQRKVLEEYEKSVKPGEVKSPTKVFEDNSVSIWDIPTSGIKISWKEVEQEEILDAPDNSIQKDVVKNEEQIEIDPIKQYDIDIENEQYIFLCDELRSIPLPIIRRISYNGNRFYTRQEEDGRVTVLTSGTTAISDGYKDSFDSLSKWRNEQILLGKDPDKYAKLRADFGTIMHYIYSLYVMKQEIPLSRGKLRTMIENLPDLKVDKDNLLFILNSQNMQELTWDIICFAKFIEDYNVEPLFTELMLSSMKYKVGSAVDFGCRMNWGVDKDGVLCNPLTRKTAEIVRINAIIDFKSNNSGAFFDEHALQLHLYKRMIEENFGGILVVDKLFNFSPKDMAKASGIGYNLKDQTDNKLGEILDDVLSMAEFKHISKKKIVVNFRGSIQMGAENKLEDKIMSDELQNILNM